MATYNIQVEDSAGNKYHPKPDLLTTKEQLRANTAAGKSVDALVVKELDNNLKNCRTYVGTDGKLHSVDGTGADTVLNFSKISKVQSVKAKTITAVSDYIGIVIASTNNLPTDIKINGVSKYASLVKNAEDVSYILYDGKQGDRIDITVSANYVYPCILCK